MSREIYYSVCFLLMLNMHMSLSAASQHIQLNTGVTCDVPLGIPANTHMCFITTIERGIVGFQTTEREAIVLRRPCPTCFPEVKTITTTQKVPQYGDVCSLQKIWRNPRIVKETSPGIRIVTTPGLLQKRKYPARILCIWNITCSGEDMMYFNMSQHDSQGQDEEGSLLCPDYIQVSAGNWSLQSCGVVPPELLLNQVQHSDMQVMFYSDRRTSGAGFRLDTTCFQPSVQRQQNEVALGNETNQNENCTAIGETSPFAKLVPNQMEQEVLQKAFQIHFQLFSLTDSCVRGVKECANNNFGMIAAQIQHTIQELKPLSRACNPLVKEIVNKTLELLVQKK